MRIWGHDVVLGGKRKMFGVHIAKLVACINKAVS